MQQKVQTYIQEHHLLTQDKPVIVGVSGGTDSVVLLHILLALGYKCIIAHCNFNLRNIESNRDEEFIRKLASDYRIPAEIISFQTVDFSKQRNISIEMAARELRYNWFEKLIEKHKAIAVAVAHHADDSVETMLLNLIRGTGLRGITGISARNKNVVRPLLCTTRSEIEIYLIEHGLEHVEDSTNALSDYKRNKIRNEVLPLLAEINPSIRQTMYGNLKRFEETKIIYQQSIDKITQDVVRVNGQSIELDIKKIKQQSTIPGVMYELLSPYNFNSKTIEQITTHLESESGKQFVSETHCLIKDRKHLLINELQTKKTDESVIQKGETEAFVPFRLAIQPTKLISEFKLSKNKKCIQVDASKITFPLCVRSWQEGDSFYPFGMNKSKKISDFYIDNKLTLFEKEQTRLLLSGDKIVWVIGHRLDNRFRITEQTIDIIEFKIDE